MSEPSSHEFQHTRFGRIELPDTAILRCNGLPGFPDARRLAILEHDRPSWFSWLVCFELPDLAFAIAEPLRFFPDYAPQVHLSDLRAINASPADELDLLAIANVTGDGSFLNLAAPLLVNPKEKLVIQAILVDSAWPLWAPLQPEQPQPAIAPERPQIESNPHR